jgi:hypothetical protein
MIGVGRGRSSRGVDAVGFDVPAITTDEQPDRVPLIVE